MSFENLILLLTGRDEAMKVSKEHVVLKTSMREFPVEMEHAMFGTFWNVHVLMQR